MKFYITTPLYYVNSSPHIGNSYPTTVADILARYHRLFGNEVFFLTGTDEHGQKVQNKAKELNKDTQQYVDEMAQRFIDIWKELNINYDYFMRTTYDYHKLAVQKALKELYDKGDIYSATYEGWYSVSDEIFYTEKDLVNGLAPTGSSVQKIEEKNYFFKMSKYQNALIQHIEKNPDFIRPDYRRNEVLGFLRKPLEDLCISRPKSRLSWGIEIPFDKDYVTYVWFDALLNYATAVGYQDDSKKDHFEAWWPQAVHLIGKDILNTHAVYWTTMLLALQIPLPKTIFAHGWWLSANNEKMSKSKGNVIQPLDVRNIIGTDGLRYFLARDVYFGNDAQFSLELVISRINSELANNLGNLLNRSTNLVSKFFDSSVPDPQDYSSATASLSEKAQKVAPLLKEDILKYSANTAIGQVVDLLNDANKYLEQQAPWKQVKTDLPAAAQSLYAALECLRIAGILLHPVMPEKMNELLLRIGWDKEPMFEDALHWGLLKPGVKVQMGEPLFPRIDLDKL